MVKLSETLDIWYDPPRVCVCHAFYRPSPPCMPARTQGTCLKARSPSSEILVHSKENGFFEKATLQAEDSEPRLVRVTGCCACGLHFPPSPKPGPQHFPLLLLQSTCMGSQRIRLMTFFQYAKGGLCNSTDAALQHTCKPLCSCSLSTGHCAPTLAGVQGSTLSSR